MTVVIPEAAVVWKLKSVGAVTANTGTDGIYTRLAPQSVDTKIKPYIVVERAEHQRPTRRLTGPDSLLLTRISVHCMGRSYEVAMTVALTVVAALDPSGVTSAMTWNGLAIDSCRVTGITDSSAPPSENDEIGFPAVTVDIDLFHLNCS